MRMMDNSADGEEELAIPEKEINLPRYDGAEPVSTEPGDYGALLAMTRPLVISKDGALSLGEGDFRAEFALRKGEILGPGRSGRGVTGDGWLAMTREWMRTDPIPEEGYDAAKEPIFAQPQRRLNLRIRIHLGMS
jgi:hypothetical protein